MPKPFDVTSKDLVERSPREWLEFAGFQVRGPVRIIDSDVSTVAAAADKFILVEELLPWLAHIEFMSGYEKGIGLRLERYSVLAEYQHQLPVHSILILLRPSADGREITGINRRQLPNGQVTSEFHYQVIRVWQHSVSDFLRGGLATLPLAPLAVASEAELPDVADRMAARINQESSLEVRQHVWDTSLILLGLRFSKDVIRQLRDRIHAMDIRESSYVQLLLEEGEAKGRVEELQSLAIRFGSRRLGPPPENIRVAIEAINDPERLEDLVERTLDATSWESVLNELKAIAARRHGG